MILKSQSGPVPEDKPNDSKVQWLLCKGAKTPEKESSQEKGTHTNPKPNIYIYIYITRERLLRIKKVEAKQIHKHLRRKKESNMKNKDEA
jgi:hypothetical protein